MASVVRSLFDWMRKQLAWSNSRQSWEERLGVLFMLVAAAGMLHFRGQLSLSVELLAWGLLLALIAVLLRRGWLKLFGPVLFYDLVRIGRRSRTIVYRGVYALLLMLLLCWIYLIQLLESSNAGRVPADQMADFAANFFYWFLGLQFTTVLVLTPAYTAGAIAEEKERRTLEFLLATDLRNREIVLSKLLARLASLAMIVLTGLPILSLLQFLGGVDPNLILAGFAFTALTMWSLGGLSMVASMWATRPRDAIALTYLACLAYLIVSGSSWLLISPLDLGSFPSTDTWSSPVTLEDCVFVVNSGNPLAALILLIEALNSGQRIDEALPQLLGDYALFHALAGLACVCWAVMRVRIVVLQQIFDQPPKELLRLRLWNRPRVAARPMMWKEIFVESGLRLSWLGRIVTILLVVLSFVPAIWICGYYLGDLLEGRASAWDHVHSAMNWWVRLVGTLVACLLLLGVAVRAASSVSGERDRQTMESLLTTPLTTSAILSAKWLGSIVSIRWGALWLGTMWLLGVVSGGVHPLAIPLLLGAWCVYASFVASLGLWFSLTSRTTTRATIWTLATITFMSVGHWFFVSMCFYMPMALLAEGLEEEFAWLPQFQFFGLTPPVTLGFLALSGWEFEEHSFLWDGDRAWLFVLFALVGLAIWLTAAVFIWLLTSIRFKAMTGREAQAPREPPSVLLAETLAPILTQPGAESRS